MAARKMGNPAQAGGLPLQSATILALNSVKHPANKFRQLFEFLNFRHFRARKALEALLVEALPR